MPRFNNGRPPGAQSPSTGNDHLTPPSLLVALRALRREGDEYVLGPDPFDLDPATSLDPPWDAADEFRHTLLALRRPIHLSGAGA